MTLRDLPKEVLSRGAVVYVRQSTGAQVQDNLESQRRQYGLVDLARQYGWVQIFSGGMKWRDCARFGKLTLRT